MSLRRLMSTDLPAVAALHRLAFPRAAVSRLGQEAARRYYQSLLSGPHDAVGLGRFDCGQLEGFAFVGVRCIAEIRYVRQHGWFLARTLVTHPWLLLESFIWSRVASGLRMLVQRPRPRVAAAPAEPDATRSYGIQYIAVDPACQGRGVGTQLLVASEEVARQRGYDEIHLSVYLDNTRAIRLYERMGWRRLSPDGIWQGLMSKRLAPVSG